MVPRAPPQAEVQTVVVESNPPFAAANSRANPLPRTARSITSNRRPPRTAQPQKTHGSTHRPRPAIGLHSPAALDIRPLQGGRPQRPRLLLRPARLPREAQGLQRAPRRDLPYANTPIAGDTPPPITNPQPLAHDAVGLSPFLQISPTRTPAPTIRSATPSTTSSRSRRRTGTR